MKKMKNETAPNKTVIAGVFVAGIIVASVFSAAYSQVSTPTAQPPIPEQETYGALGYGRGSGQNSGQRQGGGNGTQNGKMGGGQNANGLNKENCLMDGCLMVEDATYPVGELSEQTIGYLEAALADERKALATYQEVMRTFGSERPFVNIARAEEQHISMLKGLFDKYGVEIPEDTTVVDELPATFSKVCAVGVQAEIDNDQLYQDMIGDIQEQDIKQVFTSLAAASINMHLPAFERCAN